MVSIGTKIKQLSGLLGTNDCSMWIQGFLNGVIKKTSNGDDTSMLTSKQLSVIESEWQRHFSG